jgi:hypothetical protein
LLLAHGGLAESASWALASFNEKADCCGAQ